MFSIISSVFYENVIQIAKIFIEARTTHRIKVGGCWPLWKDSKNGCYLRACPRCAKANSLSLMPSDRGKQRSIKHCLICLA